MSLRNSTLTLLLLLLCAFAHGQDVVFTTTEWDFGAIKEADGAIEHDFLFRNSSKKPLRIGAASLSCNCMQAFYSRDEIPPGGTGTITVRLSPEGAAGPTRRYADIYSLEGKHLGRLGVSANVTPVDIAIARSRSAVNTSATPAFCTRKSCERCNSSEMLMRFCSRSLWLTYIWLPKHVSMYRPSP